MAPTEPDAFTTYLAGQFRAAMPDAQVEITAQLRLAIKTAAGGSTADLHGIYSSCQRNADRCDALVATHVAQMSTSFEHADVAPEQSAFRVVVRPVAYAETIRRNLAGRAEPVAAHFQGDFWVIGVADQPTTIRMLSSRDLVPLKLSIDQALAIGKQNMASAMRDHLATVQTDYHHGVALLTGDPYEASLFAFPELWAPLARAADGNLLVAVPASDVVLFTNGGDPGAVKAIKAAARVVVKHANRPFSTPVFRWSPAGWVALPRSTVALPRRG